MSLQHRLDGHSSGSPPDDVRRAPAAMSPLRESAPSNDGPDWRFSTGYVDQPLGWKTRLIGIGGVAAIALLILGGGLLTWRTYTAPPAAPTLSVFDIAPPAAPPDPPSEIPPGPEQVEKSKPLPRAERPKIDPPLIRLSSDIPVTPPPLESMADPGPPAKTTSAPEARPAPPAPQISSNAKPTWENAVLAALNRAKRYPGNAQRARQQGVPYIRFVMNREGKVLSSRLERSSGFPALDDEAVALPRRAAPLPKLPEDMPGDTIELVVPVEFYLR